MTFNIWVGGDSGKQPLSQTLEVIRAAKADVVGLQETHGHKKDGRSPDNGRKLARSEELREGKECPSRCRSQQSP
jgi:endonuclease/exonuclease/phosphatase family metal-dependent hydrolase